MIPKNRDTRVPSVCDCGEHGFVLLTRGAVALFSPDDIGLISGSYWHRARRRRTFYAARGGSTSTGERYMHRLICQGDEVDHANGDGLDNRKENIRPASRQQNAWNHRSLQGGSSRFKGVHGRTGHWYAQVSIGSKRRKHLGSFSCETCAAEAFDAAAVRSFGDFACTNSDLGLLPAMHGPDCDRAMAYGRSI